MGPLREGQRRVCPAGLVPLQPQSRPGRLGVRHLERQRSDQLAQFPCLKIFSVV